MTARGLGCEQDLDAACGWFLEAIKAGNLMAIGHLGDALSRQGRFVIGFGLRLLGVLCVIPFAVFRPSHHRIANPL